MRSYQRLRLKRLFFLMLNWKEQRKLLASPLIPQFNINHWKCGTAVCALGAAAMLPEFNKAGLVLEEVSTGNMGLGPVFKSKVNYEAGQLFFGLSREEAHYLFSPGEYPVNVTPRMVANRIQKILKKMTIYRSNYNGQLVTIEFTKDIDSVIIVTPIDGGPSYRLHQDNFYEGFTVVK